MVMMRWTGAVDMTERPPVNSDEESEKDLDRALTDALHTESLDTEVLARMQAAVGQEWRAAAVVGGRSQWPRRARWVAIAAAASLAAVTAAWFAGSSVSPVVFGSVARLNGADIDVRFAVVRHHALHEGGPLRAGDTLTAHGPALVVLSAGGTLRIAADTVIDVLSATEIRLKQGMIYVDKPPVTEISGHLQVLTQAGTLEHLGTEFEVLSTQKSVRVRVREGHIRLRSASTDVVADAGTELLATSDGGVSRGSVATYGRDWLWVAALAPDYDVEGKPLLGFLQWVSRELGRRLEFANPRVRDIAARTILHGTVRGREPLDALANVLATTTLIYEIRGDTIWVQSGP
jgi:ferric-dicitrate binding protein FerR (iron transport regulator)